ncbi:Pentatricopeptide repeat-containing protein [Striga hermonthica]|uniref:Pentatricopeptide repeat-containing protein n=1 Tax=Striga hermonthica TaxID=68872 RepID=A0A9N7MUR0_STRHE|nr:Pentatricopeptide repeat-containing protein [Striga hermonthica]
MTIMRLISRLILPKSSPSPVPRWLSTAAEAVTAESAAEAVTAELAAEAVTAESAAEAVTAESTAEAEAAAQRKKRTHLFYQVVNKARSDLSRVPHVLNNWVNQGNEVGRPDILNLTDYFSYRKNFKAALQIYNWMENRNMEITNVDKAARIDLLCKTEGITSAESYFNNLQESEKTSKTYGALLGCYCKQKLVDKAVDTFDLMKSLNFVTTINYNSMLHLYYTMGKYENLLSLVQDMEERNVPLDTFSYNMLINSHDALKNLDAIDSVVEKMESKNVADDWFTLGNLATIYFKSGLLEKAKAYLDRMEKTLARPQKDLIEACKTRINLYSQMNDLQGVLRAWRALKLDIPKPNTTCYVFMLLGLAKLGDQESLENIFKEWEESKSRFDPKVPNVLLEYYLKRDKMDKANYLYASLVQKKKMPHLRTLDLFAALCVRNGDVESGLKHLEKGLEMAKLWTSDCFPTEETVKLFLKYFEENDDPVRAGLFAERMKGLKHVNLDALAANVKVPDVEISI